MTAKHTPPGDDSFRTSLLRTAGGAVGLVAVVAVAFGLLGTLGSESDQPVVAEAPDDAEDEDAQAAAPEDEVDDTDAEPDEPAVEPDEENGDAADDEADEADDDGNGDDGEAGDDAADEDGAEEEPEPDDAEQDEPADDEGSEEADTAAERQFAPDGVTVQVLDGYQADGGSAASSVAATLREQGYAVQAQNPARRYDVTTVLFTPGFEPQARQVAADLGASEVRQQPGNLSERVQVHVVVGADRG